MKLKHILIVIGVLCFSKGNAQLKVNIGVDTTTEKSHMVIDFLNKYYSDFKEDNKVNYNDYFDESDVKLFNYPDKVAFGLIGNTTNYIMGTPYLLALDIKTDTVKAKVMFASIDSDSNLTTNFIANYYIKINDDKCKFLVTQNIETKHWQKTVIRNVTFHYPPYHKFNRKKAQTLIDSIISLEKNWNLKPIKLDYYFAETNKEIQHIKGFDFNFYMARSEYPSGLSYQKEKSVFCSGYGENYFHEIVHLYLNPIYPNTSLKEGIAVYYGGSLGKSFNEHIIRLNDYIKKHTNLNIADSKEFHYMDEQTNPQYTIQALICYLVYKKKGIEGLKKLLEIKSLNEVYQKEFDVNPNEQNIFLRKQIKQYVANKKYSACRN